MSARPSLHGRVASALATLDALEDTLRTAADEERGRAEAVGGGGDGDPGWLHLERAADAVMAAVANARMARSYVRGAMLRGTVIP